MLLENDGELKNVFGPVVALCSSLLGFYGSCRRAVVGNSTQTVTARTVAAFFIQSL